MLDFFDSVYLLTLKGKDPKKLVHLKDLFSQRLTIYEAEGVPKVANGGTMGTNLMSILNHNTVDSTALDITKNHLAMIREAHQKGYQNVLFLEDDAEFGEFPVEKQKRIQSWLEKKKWDIFYLGYCPWPLVFSLFSTRDILRVFSPLTTHAYALSRLGMEKVMHFTEKEPHRYAHIDKIFCRVPHFQKFAVFPMVCFQNQDPALYVKACDNLGVHVSFRTLSRSLETLSWVVPLTLLFLLCVLIIRKWVL